ncbi:MAG: HXXEE domain-containing protein [Bacillaceae bacterium]|nr:HXXEE domain-containing protein [Bacillaceae bacterium]
MNDIILLFPLAITLHNLEEALWLPRWSRHAKRYHQPVKPGEFHFAVIVVTLLAYLATALFMYFPEQFVARSVFVGFLGAMIFNAIFPHLVATIFLRKYAPGLITGLFLNIPVNLMILAELKRSGLVEVREVVLSTVVVGVLLLLLIPKLFRWGSRLVGEYEMKEEGGTE